MNKKYSVDYNFQENGNPLNIKMGFDSREEAEAWAKENTTDGKVIGYTRIW